MQALSKHRGFFDFFPPPQFLSMPWVGIDLSDESVKFIELVMTPDGARVGRFGEEKIPDGAISGGIIQNAVPVEKALSTLQKKHKLSFARIGCPEKEAYLLELSLPLAPLEVLRERVESRFEEYVPMKREESIFDLDVVGISEKQAIARVQVSAVSRVVAQTYETVFKNAGIIPVAFEVESQALARAVVPASEDRAVLVVDIGEKGTTFAIVRKGSVWFTSSFDVGGETLTQALRDALALSFSEAKRVKRAYGVLPSSQHADIAKTILESFQPIEEKIRQHVSYQGGTPSGQNQKVPVGQVLMCGGGSSVAGLAEYLSQTLSIPVALANPWTNIISFDEYIPSIPFDESLRYATAIGLAMPAAKTVYGE